MKENEVPNKLASGLSSALHLAGELIFKAVDGHPGRFRYFSELAFYPPPGGVIFRVPFSIIDSWWYIVRGKLGR